MVSLAAASSLPYRFQRHSCCITPAEQRHCTVGGPLGGLSDRDSNAEGPVRRDLSWTSRMNCLSVRYGLLSYKTICSPRRSLVRYNYRQDDRLPVCRRSFTIVASSPFLQRSTYLHFRLEGFLAVGARVYTTMTIAASHNYGQDSRISVHLPFADVHHCPELSIVQHSFFSASMLIAFFVSRGILDVVSISEASPLPHFRHKAGPTQALPHSTMVPWW